MRRPPLHRLRQFYDVRAFRSSLASLEALPQFAILGILSGLVTGLTILAFRGLIEFTLHLLLPEGPDAFESMSLLERGLTPIAGASCIALYFHLMKGQDLKMGVAQVLERLSHHQGYMSLRNFIVQFVAGALALISGQTGGREGPAIHLGAAASSLLGQRLSLPNNSIRVLVGCGAAAAIGSSFNTPIAGVIFAMEVILMEYTIAGFMPVILASVTGTLVVQFALGSESLFVVPSVGLSDWTEIPFIVLAGLMIGCIAAIFVRGVEALHPRLPGTQSLKLILAGAVTGVLGLGIPEVLGIGYDTVNLALAGGIGFFLLLGILVATCGHNAQRLAGLTNRRGRSDFVYRCSLRRDVMAPQPKPWIIGNASSILRAAGYGRHDGRDPERAPCCADGIDGTHSKFGNHPSRHALHRGCHHHCCARV